MRTKFASFNRCFTPKSVVLFAIVALLAVAFLPAPASAQANNCLGDVGPAKSCSANDVSIAAVQDNTVNVFQGGVVGTNKCFAGGKFSFTATFEVKTTSNKTRSNIGVFFGTQQANALHGTCTDAILSPLHSCAFVNGTATATCGSAEYEELDGAINGETTTAGSAGCGDTTSQDNSVFGAGTQAATLEVDNVTCPTNATSITLPVCTSWYQPTSTMPVCESPAPNYPWEPQAIAGTSSKCTCGNLNIPVQPIKPAVGVGKTCNTTITTGTPDFTVSPPTPNSCDAGAEGSTVTYTVNITNATPSGEGGVIIDQICDSAYGTVFDDGTLAPCAKGSAGTIVSGSASSCASLGTISSSAQCTFQAVQGEIATVNNIVSVSGHSSITASAVFGPTKSNQVTVSSSDAPTTATTTLAYAPPAVEACVTVRYNATVANTSGADESVTLAQVGTPGVAGYVSALQNGAFGDITQIHGDAHTNGSVTGTTCGVATGSSGSGSASNLTGAGAFPQTLAAGTGTPPTGGGTYTCAFDGVICGNLAPFTGCAAGLTLNDSGVNANLTLDNGEVAGPGISFTETVKPFTSNVCVVEQ